MRIRLLARRRVVARAAPRVARRGVRQVVHVLDLPVFDRALDVDSFAFVRAPRARALARSRDEAARDVAVARRFSRARGLDDRARGRGALDVGVVLARERTVRWRFVVARGARRARGRRTRTRRHGVGRLSRRDLNKVDAAELMSRRAVTMALLGS